MSDGVCERAIVGYRRDDEGVWTCLLACGHRQHVRHRPPFHVAEWIDSDVGRAAHVGSPLRCRLCEQLLMPEVVDYVRTSAVWDEHSLPRALERRHRLGSGTWGVLRVLEGQLRFVAHSVTTLEVVVTSGTSQAVPPEMEHEVHVIGPVRFALEFYRVHDGEDATGAPH